MSRDLSTREELILLAVGLLQGDAYGYSISSQIEEQTGQQISLASIHTILYRLEGDGLLLSSMGGNTGKRGGRSKRLYSLTGAGVEMIRTLQSSRSRIWNKLENILTPELKVT